MKILAIIPARRGSKGIPVKNIRKLSGKPLIEYSIGAARNSKMVNRIIVSTDDKKIAEISRKAGAETPFLRPKKLSKDNSLVIDVVKHAIEFLSSSESYTPDIITLLQPTAPLRTSKLIDKSIQILKNSEATSVLSVAEVKIHPDISFSYKKNYLKPLNPKFKKHSLRQKRMPIFYPTGSIYTFWYKTMKKFGSIYGPKIKPLIIYDKSETLDIDEPYDLFMSEMTLKYWKNYKKKFIK